MSVYHTAWQDLTSSIVTWLLQQKAIMIKQFNEADIWKCQQGHRRKSKLQTTEIQLEATEVLSKNIFLAGLPHKHELSDETQGRFLWVGCGHWDVTTNLPEASRAHFGPTPEVVHLGRGSAQLGMAQHGQKCQPHRRPNFIWKYTLLSFFTFRNISQQP